MDISVTMDRYRRVQDGFDAVAAALPAEQLGHPSTLCQLEQPGRPGPPRVGPGAGPPPRRAGA